MIWTHVLLEIYTPLYSDAWPAEGTPAEWITAGTVGYCDGEWPNAVALLPLRKLLWWKTQHWLSRLRDMFY